MKKIFLFVFMFLSFVSCDFVLKHKTSDVAIKDTLPELGIAIEKDTNGCVKEAGYKWSKIKNECIRIVDEGYRINPINDLSNLESSKSGYVLVSKDGLTAEIFLQELPQSIYLSKTENDQVFKDKTYALFVNEGYSLYKSDSLIYKAAKTVIKPVVSSDVEEQ